MLREDHIEIHKKLHKALSELSADYIRCTKKTLVETTVLEFIKWSYDQTENPSDWLEKEK
jgi:hypothetical protein